MTRAPDRPVPWLVWASVAAVWATAGAVLLFAGRLLVADLGITDARQQVLACERLAPRWTPADWQALQHSLEWGLELTPSDAVKHDLLSQLHSCHGNLLWGDEVQRRYYFSLARVQADASLRLRPAHAATLARLAVALQVSGSPAADINAAWSDALQQGPQVQANHPALAYVVLAAWDTATPQMQAWVRAQAADTAASSNKWLHDMAQGLGQQALLP